MFVDIRISEGGFVEDESAVRVACWQRSEAANREDTHKIIDEMWDAVDAKVASKT